MSFYRSIPKLNPISPFTRLCERFLVIYIFLNWDSQILGYTPLKFRLFLHFHFVSSSMCDPRGTTPNHCPRDPFRCGMSHQLHLVNNIYIYVSTLHNVNVRIIQGGGGPHILSKGSPMSITSNDRQGLTSSQLTSREQSPPKLGFLIAQISIYSQNLSKGSPSP